MTITSLVEPWLQSFVSDPVLPLLQGIVVTIAVVLVFLVFFATRDVILRTNSLIYQIIAIMMVALLPIVGFLLYLLIRPSRTIREREMHAMLVKLTKAHKESKGEQRAEKKS